MNYYGDIDMEHVTNNTITLHIPKNLSAGELKFAKRYFPGETGGIRVHPKVPIHEIGNLFICWRDDVMKNENYSGYLGLTISDFYSRFKDGFYAWAKRNNTELYRSALIKERVHDAMVLALQEISPNDKRTLGLLQSGSLARYIISRISEDTLNTLVSDWVLIESVIWEDAKQHDREGYHRRKNNVPSVQSGWLPNGTGSPELERILRSFDNGFGY